ncbi:MAG TPA: sigma 54-interacting transcriptional regulator [Longimicrobiaceae bacterium]|jgi:transcriptional regulator with GAF, ATPase, and Fis domain
MIAHSSAAQGAVPGSDCSPLARTVQELSVEQWGWKNSVTMVGLDQRLLDAQQKVLRFARSDCPVLITGETGTGKELFAKSVYLLGPRAGKPFLRINCAQYNDGNLIASELFGHRKGSFTGAVSDHRGIFEEANGGVVFLDEIGELTPGAQAMLLRTLGEGEVVPVGGSCVRKVDVRVIAATSRDLRPMVQAGTFRADLFYRLRYLWVHVPCLRERGADWDLLARHYLEGLNARWSVRREFSPEALERLGGYHWPGNVRELRSLVDMGFHLAEGPTIRPGEFVEVLDPAASPCTPEARPAGVDAYLERMTRGGESFWMVVHAPFLDRELSRSEVRRIVALGLRQTNGSYKRLVRLLGLQQDDYLKFMDFLRHHRLKPELTA